MAQDKINVLLLEDDPYYCEILKLTFAREGGPQFVVACFATIEACLNYLSENQPDVVLVDLGLPDSHGLETFVRVYARASLLPIIVLTGNNNPSLAVESMRLGAQDFLVKSEIDVKMLPRIVLNAIERKHLERKIKVAEERYRTIFEASAVAITVTDSEERIVSWNQFMETLLGLGWDDLYLKHVSTLYPEEEWRKIRSFEVRQKGMQDHLETRMIRKNGELVDVDISITVLKDLEGKITGSIGISRDITKRKMVEEALRRSEEKYRLLNEGLKDVVVGISVLGVVEYCSPVIKEFAGFEVPEVLGTPISRYFANHEDLGKALNVIQEIILHRKGATIEFLFRPKDREPFYVEVSGKPLIENDEVKAIQCVMRDISIRKKLEEDRNRKQAELELAYKKIEETAHMLVETEKMGAVGVLAAGVAHELNNPLMGMINFIQYCLKHTPAEDRRYPVLQDAERETRRCIDIVRNLLTFARTGDHQESQMEFESCCVIMDRVLRLIAHRREKEGVKITTHYDESVPKIWVNASELQQVFLNLLVNALDALAEVEAKEIAVDIASDQEFVEVKIVDSGTGIAPEVTDNIFDPFFTTKPYGEGTGLGLSIARSIIRKMNGDIRFQSEPGKTEFTVFLPIVNDDKEGL